MTIHTLVDQSVHDLAELFVDDAVSEGHVAGVDREAATTELAQAIQRHSSTRGAKP